MNKSKMSEDSLQLLLRKYLESCISCLTEAELRRGVVRFDCPRSTTTSTTDLDSFSASYSSLVSLSVFRPPLSCTTLFSLQSTTNPLSQYPPSNEL